MSDLMKMLTMTPEQKRIGAIGGPQPVPPGVGITEVNELVSGTDIPTGFSLGTNAAGQMGPTSSKYQYGKGG